MKRNNLHFFRSFLLLQILTGSLVLTMGQMMGLLQQESLPLGWLYWGVAFQSSCGFELFGYQIAL